MAGAVQFTPGSFYVCKSKTQFRPGDVEGSRNPVALKPGTPVRCSTIVHRSGMNGRGDYAKLHVRLGRTDVVLYHRVSKNRIGSGTWEEMNDMMVLALADDLNLD